jgi:hypothetical protein
MSTNKDLLKQAIAEAKTIREAAIANAKEALEESLTPHLKEMLAQKLQEMEEEDMEETVNQAEFEDFSEDPTGHGNIGDLNEAEKEEEEAEEEEEETEETEEETEETEEEDEDIEVKDMSVEELKDLIRDIVAQETGAEDETEEELPAEEMPADDMTGTEEEEIDINELLRELEEGDYEEEEVVAEKKNRYMEGMKKPKMEAMKKPNPMEEDLEEALNTVAELRKQLQEVNLLNAKLLYVNKVFKANNLTEGQKVNVVAAFDKAETVKEVKLVYETVSKNVVANQSAKPAIREHKSFASKPAGSTKKQVINEVSEAVTRMQILAGIKPREY